MTTRCKFRCESVEPCGEQDGRPQVRVKLVANYDPDLPQDRSFSKYTPSGSFEAVISNPAVVGGLEPGRYYWLDLTAVEPAA